MPGKNLLRIHAAGLAFPAGARSNHKIVRPVDDRLNQGRNEARNIAAIAIEENDQIAFIGNRRDARRAGATISGRRRNHLRSRVSGAFRGSVSAAVINNNDFARSSRCDYFAHHLGDWFFFVQCWNDSRNPHVEKSGNRLFAKNLFQQFQSRTWRQRARAGERDIKLTALRRMKRQFLELDEFKLEQVAHNQSK